MSYYIFIFLITKNKISDKKLETCSLRISSSITETTRPSGYVLQKKCITALTG